MSKVSRRKGIKIKILDTKEEEEKGGGGNP